MVVLGLGCVLVFLLFLIVAVRSDAKKSGRSWWEEFRHG